MKNLLGKLAALADELDKIDAPEMADKVDTLVRDVDKQLVDEIDWLAREEEAAKSLGRMVECPRCNGSGAGEDSPWCDMCKGEGQVAFDLNAADDGPPFRPSSKEVLMHFALELQKKTRLNGARLAEEYSKNDGKYWGSDIQGKAAHRAISDGLVLNNDMERFIQLFLAMNK